MPRAGMPWTRRSSTRTGGANPRTARSARIARGSARRPSPRRRVFYTNLWACGIATVICAATEPQTLLTLRWTRESMAALAVSAALGVGMSYFAFICRASVSATCFTILGNVCKARRHPAAHRRHALLSSSPRAALACDRRRLASFRRALECARRRTRSALCLVGGAGVLEAVVVRRGAPDGDAPTRGGPTPLPLCPRSPSPAAQVLTVFINVVIWDKHASQEGLACLAVSLVAAALYQQAPKRTPADAAYARVAISTGEKG